MIVVKFGLRIARQEDKDFKEAELWLMSLLPHDSGSLYPKIPTAVYTAIMVIFRSLAKARLAKSHNHRPLRGYQADWLLSSQTCSEQGQLDKIIMSNWYFNTFRDRDSPASLQPTPLSGHFHSYIRGGCP